MPEPVPFVQEQKYKGERAAPLKAGFLTAPEARGANVVAAPLANFETWTQAPLLINLSYIWH
jgi:hypothetical protein